MFNYRNLAGNVERVNFYSPVSERVPGERCSVLPQGLPKCEVYVCEGIRESIALETGRTTDAKTEAGEDGRC